MLRVAVLDDVRVLQQIEIAAGELFRPLGMDLVADDEPPSPTLLRGFIDAHRAWVVESGREIAGYLLAAVVDGCAHLEQVTVHPRHARRRHGAALVEHLARWALDRGLPAMTLTTYRHVPWNGPYYATLGFRWLSDDELSPTLRRLRVEEAGHGLDRWPRGCMRRDLVVAGAAGGRARHDVDPRPPRDPA